MKCMAEVLTRVSGNRGVPSFSEVVTCHCRHTHFKLGSRSQASNVCVCLGHINSLSIASICPRHSEERPLSLWLSPLQRNRRCCDINDIPWSANSLWIFERKWNGEGGWVLHTVLFLFMLLPKSYQIKHPALISKSFFKSGNNCRNLVKSWGTTFCPFHNAAQPDCCSLKIPTIVHSSGRWFCHSGHDAVVKCLKFVRPAENVLLLKLR